MGKPKSLMPLNLQFFADGGEQPGQEKGAETNPDAAGANQSAANVNQTSVSKEAHAQAPDMTAITKAIVDAVEAATSKKEKAVVRSMAEQYGLNEDECARVLEKAKADKAAQLPPEIRAQMEAMTKAANERLISADVRSVGVSMGLVDADMALLAIDRSGLKVDTNGAVTGVKEALEALKAAKGYLFKPAAETPAAQPTGARVDVGAPTVQTTTPDYDSMSDEEYFRSKAQEKKG